MPAASVDSGRWAERELRIAVLAFLVVIDVVAAPAAAALRLGLQRISFIRGRCTSRREHAVESSPVPFPRHRPGVASRNAA
jgi:hypothetical protein